VLEDKDLVSIQQVRTLVEKAHQALLAFKNFSQQQVDQIVTDMAKAAESNARRLAEMAVEETGYGKVEDKTIKNLFSAVDVYRYIKDLKTCDVVAENKKKRVIDIAVPAGVIAVITPTTNPTSTAIFKILCALKGRNTVVVSPHPYAVRCTCEAARIMYEAALQAGAPEGCVNWLETVTLEGTTALMKHRKTNLILATGGPGVVRAAYSSGKPAFGVGPGNVPAFIERTADVAKAVRDVVAGKTFDWGVLCSSEQSLVCDQPVTKQVLKELSQNGAYLLNDEELKKLNQLIQLPTKGLNPAIVGKAPQVIAQMAGFSVPSEIVCLVGRPGGVGQDYPLSMEKLSPILAFYEENGWEAACQRCIEILNFGGLGHTMAIHSKDQHVIMQFGLYKPAYRICVNTAATHGSVGMTTGVPPSMTLGCGTPGGNITSDNITPLHLINLKRLAFETLAVDQIQYQAVDQSSTPQTAEAPQPAGQMEPVVDVSNVRESVRDVVGQLFRQKRNSPKTTNRPVREGGSGPPVTISSFKEEAPLGPPADFVCEDDVRQALTNGSKIVVNSNTIITPAAQDLGQEKSVLVWDS